MGILRLGDENHDEGGRGPNLSRRGALKLSAGSIATFAMATAGGVTSAVLTSPEAAQAQAVTDGGYLPNVPARRRLRRRAREGHLPPHARRPRLIRRHKLGQPER